MIYKFYFVLLIWIRGFINSQFYGAFFSPSMPCVHLVYADNIDVNETHNFTITKKIFVYLQNKINDDNMFDKLMTIIICFVLSCLAFRLLWHKLCLSQSLNQIVETKSVVVFVFSIPFFSFYLEKTMDKSRTFASKRKKMCKCKTFNNLLAKVYSLTCPFSCHINEQIKGTDTHKTEYVPLSFPFFPFRCCTQRNMIFSSRLLPK